MGVLLGNVPKWGLVAHADSKAVFKELVYTALLEEEILPEREADEKSATGSAVSPVDVLLRELELKTKLEPDDKNKNVSMPFDYRRDLEVLRIRL